MISAICRTNLDGYENTRWPTVFVALPRPGDRVAGRGSRLSGVTHPELRVVGVTHAMSEKGDPYVTVELHK